MDTTKNSTPNAKAYGKPALDGISLAGLFQRVSADLIAQGYSDATICTYLRSARMPYKKYSKPETEIAYSSEASLEWRAGQEERRKRKIIGDSRMRCINAAIGICEIYFWTGTTERLKALYPKKQILHVYEQILEGYLLSLSGKYAPRTIDNHECYSRGFFHYVGERFGDSLEGLAPTHIEEYFIAASPTHANSMPDVLRMTRQLLEFLSNNRFISFYPDFRFMKPAASRKPVLPCFTHKEVDGIVSKIDRATNIGKRDYAVILLAARTGMRGVDVFNMKLHDIDWFKNEIRIVQSKTRKCLYLPLDATVGNAIADYILNARPGSGSPYIFLRVYAPHKRMSKNGSGNTILKKYLTTNEPGAAGSGARTYHALRRSIGTWMANDGAPLPLIAEALGHSDPNSAKRYLAFDAGSMQKCCLSFSAYPLGKGWG